MTQVWRTDPETLRRWKSGTLGVPLVDANMRELLATGFMSNRGRQNVASYLALDLQLDWREGAEHFEDLLLDYDVCSKYARRSLPRDRLCLVALPHSCPHTAYALACWLLVRLHVRLHVRAQPDTVVNLMRSLSLLLASQHTFVR